MYYVTTFIPAIYYNHPLCRLAMLAPLEGGEFYSAFQRITIHVGMDRVLQAYRGMMRQLAAFEHYCVVKRGEGGEKMKLSQEIVDAAKLRMKLAISTTLSGSLESEENKKKRKEGGDGPESLGSAKGLGFVTSGGVVGGWLSSTFSSSITSLLGIQAATESIPYLGMTTMTLGGVLAGGLFAVAGGYWAWNEYAKKIHASKNPEYYGLTIAAILDKSQAAVKGNTEINSKLEVYYRLEQLRYKMNMFSSILAGIMTPSDISTEELLTDGERLADALTSSS